jgi:hypothetical protein
MDLMSDSTDGSQPEVPGETDAFVSAWMQRQGWRVAPGRWHLDPDGGFFIWQEEGSGSNTRALWIAELMLRRLSAERLGEVLDAEDVANEIRISQKIRSEPRGDGYRVSVVSRSSGEWKRMA